MNPFEKRADINAKYLVRYKNNLSKVLWVDQVARTATKRTFIYFSTQKTLHKNIHIACVPRYSDYYVFEIKFCTLTNVTI